MLKAVPAQGKPRFMPCPDRAASAKRRKPWAAALFSLACPGLGQIYASLTTRGLRFLGVSCALAAASLAAALFRPSKSIMVVLFILTAADWLWRLYGIADAARCAKQVGVAPPTRLNRPWVYSTFIVGAVVWSFSMDALVQHKVWQLFTTGASSMEPNVRVNDYVMVWLDRNGATKPHAGDLVIFSTRENIIYMKRIVGLPGDRIQLLRNRLIINGQPVDLTPTLIPDYSLGRGASAFMETLPNGKSFGILHYRTDGPAATTEEQTVPPDHYFVLGDNRDNSADSRFPEIGVVPREKILGYLSFIVWAKDWSRIGQSLQ